MISLTSIKTFALDLLEALLPVDGHDDTMAIADAVGVSTVDDPIPYTVVDRLPFPTHEQQEQDRLAAEQAEQQRAAHDTICQATELLAALRSRTLSGHLDWAAWEREVRNG